jgi:amidase
VAELAVTRSVRDTAALLDVVAGPMPGDLHTPPPPHKPYLQEVGADPGRLRVGMLTTAPDRITPTHPDCVAAAEATGRLLETLGHTVEAIEVGPFDMGDALEYFLPCYSVWTAADVDLYGRRIGRPLTADDMELGTWTIAEIGRAATGQQYLAGLQGLHRLSAKIQSWWAESPGWDLLLTPTIPEPPPTLGQFVSTPDNPLGATMRASAIIPFTMPFNITGQPAVSVPVQWNDAGLPIGMQLVAAYGREDLLIQVASQLEAAQPWADRRPAL